MRIRTRRVYVRGSLESGGNQLETSLDRIVYPLPGPVDGGIRSRPLAICSYWSTLPPGSQSNLTGLHPTPAMEFQAPDGRVKPTFDQPDQRGREAFVHEQPGLTDQVAVHAYSYALLS